MTSPPLRRVLQPDDYEMLLGLMRDRPDALVLLRRAGVLSDAAPVIDENTTYRLMKVVMAADENSAGHTRGTSNWAAHIGRAVYGAMTVLKYRNLDDAPKDGTRVLLWERYSDAPFVGYWRSSIRGPGGWAVDIEHVDAEGGWDGANVVDRITQEFIDFWAPLPANPPNEDPNAPAQ